MTYPFLKRRGAVTSFWLYTNYQNAAMGIFNVLAFLSKHTNPIRFILLTGYMPLNPKIQFRLVYACRLSSNI